MSEAKVRRRKRFWSDVQGCEVIETFAGDVILTREQAEKIYFIVTSDPYSDDFEDKELEAERILEEAMKEGE